MSPRKQPSLSCSAAGLSSTEPADSGANAVESTGQSLATGVARGGLWGFGGQAATLGATLVASPFTIRLLGPAKYGLWSLLQSALTYFQLAEIGMRPASTRFAAERYARDDPRGEAAVVWTALAITVALTGAAALAASLAAPFLVARVFHVEAALRGDGVFAFRLVCVAAAAYAVAGVVNTPQQVRMRWGSLTLATSGPVVLQTAAAPIVLVTTMGGIVALGALMAAASVAAAVLNFRVAIRLLPGLRRPRPAAGVLGQVVRYGGVLAVAGVALVPLTTAERFFLAHYRSSTAVAYYAAAAALAGILTVIPAVVSQPLLPALARLTAQGRHQDLKRLYHQVLRGVFLVATPAALVLAFVARPFLGLWAGPAYEAHSVVPFYIIVAGLWFNTLAYVPANHLLAAGNASTFAAILLVQLVPYLLMAAALTAAFGTVGAAMAWSIRVAATCVVTFAVVRHRYGLPWVPTPRRGRASLVGVACLSGTLWALSAVTSSLSVRAAWSVAALAIYGVAVWRIVLTSQERQALLALLHSATMAP